MDINCSYLMVLALTHLYLIFSHATLWHLPCYLVIFASIVGFSSMWHAAAHQSSISRSVWYRGVVKFWFLVWATQRASHVQDQANAHNRSISHTTQCSMFNTLYSMYNVQCSIFFIQCTMFNVLCSVFDAQCSILKIRPTHTINPSDHSHCTIPYNCNCFSTNKFSRKVCDHTIPPSLTDQNPFFPTVVNTNKLNQH